MIRVLIVDDQAAVRQGLNMMLATTSDVFVVGAASNGEAALGLAASLCPHVVLMDVEMPGMDGVTATQALHRISPRIRIIVLSIHDDDHTRARAQDAGAAAFVAKSMPPDTLLAAIRRVAGA